MPRAFSHWLPYLWSNVVFPGTMVDATRARWQSLLWLLLLPALFLYPTRDFLLFEPDEGRYAQIGREMLERGDAVVPYLQGEPYLDKPPFFYWLVMASYQLFGVSDQSARLVPALAVHLTILLVYLLGRRSLGERAAFWSALMLMLMPGFLGMGRILILDGWLTLWITLSLLLGFEAIRGSKHHAWYWRAASIACGFGVLTKGPIAVLLLVPPLLAYQRLTNAPGRVPLRGWALFALLVLMVNVPWYTAIFCCEPLFLRYFFWDHNVLRFLSPFDHLQPVWFYLPILLGGLLPGTLLIVSMLRYLNSTDEAVVQQRPPALGFWLLAGSWCVFFFSMSGSKLPTYVLPAFPCFALALGYFVTHSQWQRSTLWRGSLVASGVFLLFVCYVALPWYARERSPMGRPELVTPYVNDPDAAVVCYPRHVDSVAFYLDRDDLSNVRSKETHLLIQDLLTRPRTVVLCTHRHSLEALKQALPPSLQVSEEISLERRYPKMPWLEKVVGATPWGLCDIGVIEIKELARPRGTAQR